MMGRASAALTILLLAASAACRDLGPIARGEERQEVKDVSQPLTAEVRLGQAVGAVNRLVLGNNVQWVDRGDGLLTADGTQFDRQMLALVEELGPTVLRYPGGVLADTFEWRSGSGPISARGTSERFEPRQRQPVLFGTAEFLALCKDLHAEPFLTVNVATGSPRDAADWLRAVNGPAGGVAAGPVHYWEIGNEPYLKEQARPEVAVEPATFASRANAFIRAMREADDTIAIGIPLRRDRMGAMSAVAFPGFAETVLGAVEERFDFISLHDAYLPFIAGPAEAVARESPDDVFRASMAAYQVVEDDLNQVRQMVSRRYPERRLPFAISEYNAIYTLHGALDGYIASLGGALYIADLLRVMAARDDILLANFWSLTGNWYFGAVSAQRQLRPAYHVLKAYSEILRGQRLEVDVRSPTFDAPAIGAVPASRGVPTVAAFATSYAGRASLLLINKSVTSRVVVTIQGASPPVRVARELTDARLFDGSHEAGGLRWRDVTVETGTPLRVPVSAHSLLWLELTPR